MKKVLVIDDNVSFLKQISALLEDSYDLFLAKSGIMGLKIGAQEKPDLVLLDVEMPEMDGFAVIARLKGDPCLSSIPVIFLTGNHDEATKDRALESGGEDLLAKPVEKGLLISRIEFCIGRPESRDQGQT